MTREKDNIFVQSIPDLYIFAPDYSDYAARLPLSSADHLELRVRNWSQGQERPGYTGQHTGQSRTLITGS